MFKPAKVSPAGRRPIVMIGTAREGAGGIASVISTYAAHGLFARWPIVTLDSHVVGTHWRKGWVFIDALLRFFVMLLGRRVGLLHLHTSSGPSFWRKACFACLAFAFGRPVLLHIHSGGFMSFYRDSCGPAMRRVVRFILARSTRVIALSPAWRALTLTITLRANVVCIPNPVITVGGRPRLLRQRVVLFLGKVCAEKGVFDLINAWKRVQADVGGARLVLAGDGDLEAARQQIRLLGLVDSVELPGWVSGVEKDALLARTAVCVLPSYFEGMPMSLLEAMGTGIPCVASTVGGIPDMMTDGVEGRLIQAGDVQALADALSEVLLHEERYAAMSQAALARFVSEYSADVVIPELEKLYRDMGMKPR
jgi:glycosyltransferase involved in cell wall biosynthesis